MNTDSRTDATVKTASSTNQLLTPQLTEAGSGSYGHRKVQVAEVAQPETTRSYKAGHSSGLASRLQSKAPLSVAQRLYQRWNYNPEDSLRCDETYEQCFRYELSLPDDSQIHEEVPPQAPKAGSKRPAEPELSASLPLTKNQRRQKLRSDLTNATELLKDELPDDIKDKKLLGKGKVVMRTIRLIRDLKGKKTSLLSQQRHIDKPCSSACSSSLSEVTSTAEAPSAPYSLTDETAIATQSKKHLPDKKCSRMTDQKYRSAIREAFDNLGSEVGCRASGLTSKEQATLRARGLFSQEKVARQALEQINELKKSIQELEAERDKKQQ